MLRSNAAASGALVLIYRQSKQHRQVWQLKPSEYGDTPPSRKAREETGMLAHIIKQPAGLTEHCRRQYPR
jgi:hypothetical protein